jgi:cytochrome c oxidase subunit II
MSAEHSQSTLHAAAGSSAETLHELGLVLYVGAALIFIAVMYLAVRALIAPERAIKPGRWILGGGILLPVAVLSALLVYSLTVVDRLDAEASPDPLRIVVTGKQWWWEVRYALPGSTPIVLANELHVPIGRAIQLELATADVIHSFWAPSLAGKVDMIPGRTNRLVIRVDEPGVYRGQCAEYCGGQHALMAFYVVAEDEASFRTWLAREAQPARDSDDAFLRLGREMFFRGGCQRCHRIRGTDADGSDGPDLTHVGSRRSLAAGVLRNHVGTMAGWIAGAQDVKPGNRMPSMNVYTGRELRALSAWLESLQ